MLDVLWQADTFVWYFAVWYILCRKFVMFGRGEGGVKT